MAMVLNKAGSEAGIAVNSTLEGVFELKEALKAQGWTVPRSGDGTTYDSGGDILTHTGSGAGGLGNSRAWFEISAPDGRHNFIFQVIFPTYSWRGKYSENPFSGGSPSGNTCGSAVDEVVLGGSGTDASPSGETWGTSTITGRIVHIGVDDAAPYGFWIYSYFTGSGNEDWAFALDPLQAGSYDAADPFPYVVGVWPQTPDANDFVRSVNPWTKIGGSWTEVAASGLEGWGNANTIAPEFGGVDPVSGADITIPTIWGRQTSFSAPNGYKGVSSLFEVGLASRNNGDTGTRSTTRDRIYIFAGGVTAAWNGEIPTV